MSKTAFELDGVAIWVLKIDCRPLAFGAELNNCLRAARHVVRLQVNKDFSLVERLYAKAEVIDVPALASCRGAAQRSDRPIHRDEVDQRGAGAQMNQSAVPSLPLHGAAEETTMELDRAVEVGDPKDDMVQPQQSKGWRTGMHQSTDLTFDMSGESKGRLQIHVFTGGSDGA